MPPIKILPPGAVLETELESGHQDDDPDRAFVSLVHALSGLFCASFQTILSKHSKSKWNHPTDVPWGNDKVRWATLPYEPVCN